LAVTCSSAWVRRRRKPLILKRAPASRRSDEWNDKDYDVLLQALTRLSPEHREIIDLVYYHEKSVEECAQVLGIPAATVKTRMFYARKKLAEMVKRHGNDLPAC
jgi:RNA polymerase sigma-70 factor (ECF subfamily)